MTATGLIAIGLDRDAGTPLHRQLYDRIRALILDRALAPDSRLPSTRTLAAELGVSRNTVLAAFDQLAAEGYLVGAVGSGSYVATALPDAMPAPGASGARPRAGRGPGLSRRGRALAGVSRMRRPTTGAFPPGLPALDLFPTRLWARLLARPWRRPGTALLGPGEAAGDPELRCAIAAYLRPARALDCDAAQVIVVSGAQQGLDLAARLLLDPGDLALVEEPGYRALNGPLIAAGARIVAAPVDGEGIDIGAGARHAEGARLVCVTPSHQFPLGVTMSLGRRLALLDWAAATDAWILEDDYDSEYRYGGRPLAALQGLDRAGRVVYVGSFSKVMFPSLRLGYLVVPPDLAEPFARARAALDDHPPAATQAALARFIVEGHFASHLRRMRRLYAERQAALVAAGARHLDGLLTIAASEAGMHLVAGLRPELARRMDDREASLRAARAGIAAPPLAAHYRAAPDRRGLLLGYAAVPVADIDPAAAHLAAALRG